MSKFLLNLLVQISKAFVYSKIQILFGKNSTQLSAHLAFRPSRGLFFLFFQPADFLSPPHWASASRPAQPTITAQLATGRLLPPASKPKLLPPVRRPSTASRATANPAIGLAYPPFLSPAPRSELSGTGAARGRAPASS
jgi:hypothetical protein